MHASSSRNEFLYKPHPNSTLLRPPPLSHLTTTTVYVSDPSGVVSGAAINTPPTPLDPLSVRAAATAADSAALVPRRAADCALTRPTAGEATNPAIYGSGD